MKNIIYTLIIILLFSCKEDSNIQNKKILHIERKIFSSEQNIYTNNFFSDVHIIRLETNDNILISRIRRIYLYKDLLFILHDHNISCFNKKGEFVRKIGKRGNGPGEYSILPNEIAFCDNYIYVNDHNSHKILIYTIQGEYINSFNTNRLISQLKILNNKMIIGYTPNRNGKEPNKLYAYTLDGNIIDSIKNNNIYKDFKLYIIFSHEQPMFISENNSIHFREVLSDTIYTLKENFSLEANSILNTGDLKLKKEDIYTRTDINKIFINGQKVLEIIFDNETYMIIQERDARFTCLVWDKKKNNINNVKFIYSGDMAKLFNKEKSYMQVNSTGTSAEMMIEDGTPYFKPKFVSEDNKYLIGYETSATNEDDNPIIVLAEMK